MHVPEEGKDVRHGNTVIELLPVAARVNKVMCGGTVMLCL